MVIWVLVEMNGGEEKFVEGFLYRGMYICRDVVVRKSFVGLGSY